MKNSAFITGSSRGLGRAIAEQLLQTGEWLVHGISRTHVIQHANYVPIELDLSNMDSVHEFSFDQKSNCERVLLINNAGVLGSIGPVGSIPDSSVHEAYTVNLISPSVLMNKFLAADMGESTQKVVMNVSSGAGKRPIDGWASYCASKAGLDMYTQTVAEELKIKGEKLVRVISIAPGIVDTGMQDQIRTATADAFSRIDDFIEYKENGDLVSPEVVASKYIYILNNLRDFPEALYSVRDVAIETT